VDQLPASLSTEIQEFSSFLTTKFYGQQAPPIRSVTAAKYIDHLR
jgi:hypothetical protein